MKDPFKDLTETLHDRSAFLFVDKASDPFPAPAFNIHLGGLETGIVFTFTIDPGSLRLDAIPLRTSKRDASHPSVVGLPYKMNPTEQCSAISELPLADTERENKRLLEFIR